MERERLKAAAGSRVSLVGVAVGSRALRAVASKESCLVCNAQSAVGKEPVPVTSTNLHQKHNSFPPENNASVYSESSICVCERDEDVGSVSTVCSDMESDFVDVALEACWR